MDPEFCAAHSHDHCLESNNPSCLRDDMFCFGHYDFNGDGLTDSGPSLCQGKFLKIFLIVFFQIKPYSEDLMNPR